MFEPADLLMDTAAVLITVVVVVAVVVVVSNNHFLHETKLYSTAVSTLWKTARKCVKFAYLLSCPVLPW